MSKLAAFELAIEEKGGEDAFFDRLAEAENLEDLAREYGASLRTVNLWKNATDERRAAWDEALNVSSHVLAADAKRILDKLHERHTPEPGGRPKERLESSWVALAQARATQRMKLAAARNPAAYGERPQVQVNTQINLGELHLQALRARGSMAHATAQVAPGTSKMLGAGSGPEIESGNIVEYSSQNDEDAA